MCMYDYTYSTFPTISCSHVAQRARNLMSNGSRISPSAYAHRKHYYNNPEEGLLTKKAYEPPDQPQVPRMDGMMKNTGSMFIQNFYYIGFHTLVDTLYSGFIAAKLPFSLFRGYKPIVHGRIDLSDLELSYLSSSSWLLVNFTGMAAVNEVLFGYRGLLKSLRVSPYQFQGPLGVRPLPPVSNVEVVHNAKSFQAQKDSLEQKAYMWDADDSVHRLAQFAGHVSGSKHASQEKRFTPRKKEKVK
eukprot:TRINITY_DN3625_c0_g2_i3.p1 TRINITY_DN3625_c0_g2~~TRINITY_DN3625_c0_g2_i3.p1  ORF type:complete len:244 (+),score=29.44 TRINITY_DN3625_c0_g2_i3:247-978(+)